MFHTRYSLHKQVYSHRVSKAIEYMICDALDAADQHLRISEIIHSPQEYASFLYSSRCLSRFRSMWMRLFTRDRYLHLTDTVLHDIEASRDTSSEMLRAKAILAVRAFLLSLTIFGRYRT
jgi:HD superfamily phosphohydrolase